MNFGFFGKKDGSSEPELPPPSPFGGAPSKGGNSSGSSSSGESSKGGSSSGGGKGNPTLFDPTGLERAAKAARELDSSKNSKSAIEITLTQEKTKQLEQQIKIREWEAQLKTMEIKKLQAEHEERRKDLEMETSHITYRNKQQDELARKRNLEQMEAQRRLQEEQLKKQEESILKQEQLKRQTIEFEKQLQKQNDKSRIDAEIEGKIKYERENRNLHVENMKLQASELRETILQGIKTAGETIGSGVKDFLSDKQKLTTAVASISLVALGIYTARTSTSIIGKYVESQIGKPSLVRETSRKSLVQVVRHPLKTIKENFKKEGQDRDLLGGVILNPTLSERMRGIAWTTINSRKNGAPFRNLLLHGPPGTGKTMFAKNLAHNSGMDYAILTGADVAPLGKEAVTEIHKLFDWANKSRKGLVLFVDEADAFLRKRSKDIISEDLRNALNSFLYRTGDSSKKFMLVLASNQPEQFDWAINDRVDEIVEFDLPGKKEREFILERYWKKYMVTHPELMKAKPILIEGITMSDVHQIADQTEGFSGRELSKLAIGWQAAAYGTPNHSLNKDTFLEVVKQHIQQRKQKEDWNKLDNVKPSNPENPILNK